MQGLCLSPVPAWGFPTPHGHNSQEDMVDIITTFTEAGCSIHIQSFTFSVNPYRLVTAGKASAD